MAEARDSIEVSGAGGQAFMPPADFDAPLAARPDMPTAAPIDGVLAGDGAQHDIDLVAPLPPADASPLRGTDKRRAAVDAMVERCLDPAMGLACRTLAPAGTDPEGREEARKLVMRALADCARKRISDDDESARAVMRRVAEFTMDALVAHPGSASPAEGVDLESILGPDGDPEALAPMGLVPHAVLQDSLAASRATDRQVGYAVLAASVTTEDASSLLGIDPDELQSSLSRIGRRLAESQGRPSPGQVA
ncbi:MAG: hypothetical protein GY812_12135 [Actinomycetia bacterium]|nr:hypothetical protein [Actinomycetes bacterium]